MTKSLLISAIFAATATAVPAINMIKGLDAWYGDDHSDTGCPTFKQVDFKWVTDPKNADRSISWRMDQDKCWYKTASKAQPEIANPIKDALMIYNHEGLIQLEGGLFDN